MINPVISKAGIIAKATNESSHPVRNENTNPETISAMVIIKDENFYAIAIWNI